MALAVQSAFCANLGMFVPCEYLLGHTLGCVMLNDERDPSLLFTTLRRGPSRRHDRHDIYRTYRSEVNGFKVLILFGVSARDPQCRKHAWAHDPRGRRTETRSVQHAPRSAAHLRRPHFCHLRCVQHSQRHCCGGAIWVFVWRV